MPYQIKPTYEREIDNGCFLIIKDRFYKFRRQSESI